MQYFTDFKLKNSFNLPCIVQEIWFPESDSELAKVYTEQGDAKILSGCTNILCRPLVNKVISLKHMPKRIDSSETERSVIINCDANTSTHKLVKYLLEKNCGGLEGLYSLPGSVGGAIVMNAGSGNSCITDNLVFVNFIDKSGEENMILKNHLYLERRYSIFQSMSCVIKSAYFCFPKKRVDLELLDKTKQHRKSFPKYPSAGGIFVNWHDLKPYSEKLIGLSVNDAEVSHMPNIIINKGHATFDDVLKLIVKIQGIVQANLKLEVEII